MLVRSEEKIFEKIVKVEENEIAFLHLNSSQDFCVLLSANISLFWLVFSEAS